MREQCCLCSVSAPGGIFLQVDDLSSAVDGLTVVCALDNVDVVDVANTREKIDHLLFADINGKATDKNRTTVDVIFAKELFVSVGTRDEVLLLDIEDVDAISVVFADGLWGRVSTPETRPDELDGRCGPTALRSRLGSNVANSTKTA